MYRGKENKRENGLMSVLVDTGCESVRAFLVDSGLHGAQVGTAQSAGGLEWRLTKVGGATWEMRGAR